MSLPTTLEELVEDLLKKVKSGNIKDLQIHYLEKGEDGMYYPNCQSFIHKSNLMSFLGMCHHSARLISNRIENIHEVVSDNDDE